MRRTDGTGCARNSRVDRARWSRGGGVRCSLARSAVRSATGWCDVERRNLRALDVVLEGTGGVEGSAIRLSV
jgi:hypothetical protein